MSRRMDAFDREPASMITGTALSTVSDSVTVALTFRFTAITLSFFFTYAKIRINLLDISSHNSALAGRESLGSALTFRKLPHRSKKIT